MSSEELRRSLAETLGTVADARAHLQVARELLEQSRRILVDAQAQARPWLPPQLGEALEQFETYHARLHEVDELLDHYRSRL